jgi:diacylglycerol kinase family enzyme
MLTALPGIGVVTNPRSKVNRRDPAGMHRLAYLLGARGEAEQTSSLEDLDRVAERFKAAGIDVLGINGGDGTLSVTLTAFIRAYQDTPLPKIAILRGGTLNTIAAGLGIRGTSGEILFEVIERYHERMPFKLVERPILRIGEQYGFIFGNGLIANFLEAYYATGRPSRLMRRVVGEVRVDGLALPYPDYATFTCATVPEIGLGFAPYAHCWQGPEHAAYVGFHCGATGLVAALPRLFRRLPVSPRHGAVGLAREIVIESDAEMAYTVDGDLYRTDGPLTIGVGPKLQIIVPDGGVTL